MAFVGGTQLCLACNKTVYPVDRVAPDNKQVYHRACFRCTHCNNTLKIANFNSIDGTLYCKPHFDQLYKQTGSLEKSFEGTSSRPKAERVVDPDNKVASNFPVTSEKCVVCNKTVYPTEKISVNKTAYHRGCFKCIHGGCTISLTNYMSHDGKPYCKYHHTQLIKEKGNLSQLEGSDE
ncbi:Transcription factor lim1 [Heracleum sosnowskyi]|uniref:Transcription factor lim1 n=1 Tax=Heracleum sosnowskyi TaxID=360622 RepID=A0AAD8M364_9APIA|nr:Transcription factor lim1 [Heracleum sosnowskyi]